MEEKTTKIMHKDGKTVLKEVQAPNLRHADLRWADLEGANLKHADLRWADLEGANLRYAHLEYADLKHVDLKHADLEGATLIGAKTAYCNVNFSPDEYDQALQFVEGLKK